MQLCKSYHILLYIIRITDHAGCASEENTPLDHIYTTLLHTLYNKGYLNGCT